MARKVIEADEIRVGPILICTTPDGGAGIWIDRGKDRDMIALFSTDAQTGVGIYAKGERGQTNVCLFVNERGEGAVQFAGPGGSSLSVSLSDLAALQNLTGRG